MRAASGRIRATARSDSTLLVNGRRLAVGSQSFALGSGVLGGAGEFLHAGRARRGECRHLRRYQVFGGAAGAQDCRQCRGGNDSGQPGAHRYSLSRGQRPNATASAAPMDRITPPTVVPDSTRCALKMSLRN